MTPRWRVRIEREAEVDIADAAVGYEARRIGLGGEFLAQLEVVIEWISEGPLRFPEIEKGTRRALLHRFPYGVYFILEDSDVAVRAVLHLHRHPDVWRRRSFG